MLKILFVPDWLQFQNPGHFKEINSVQIKTSKQLPSPLTGKKWFWHGKTGIV